MRLFLAAEAKHPESIAKLEAFIGGSLARKKVVYIPTGSNGERWGCWKKGSSIKVAKRLMKNIKVVQLEQVSREMSIEEIIGTPDILWMAGGVPGYLLYWIRRTKLDKYLHKLFEAGTIYVGSSAGSMICAPSIYLSEIWPDEQEPGAYLIPGLGYINFEIFPHYEDSNWETINRVWGKEKPKLLLLRNGDAVTVIDDKVEILGEKNYLN